MFSSDVSEMFNSGLMKQIRKDMLEGKKIKGCEQCYETEARGLKSDRQIMIDTYGFTNDVKLTEMEMAFDNVCNLKCRMCTSASSHQIIKDEIEIYGETLFDNPKYIRNDSFNNVDYSSLRKIQIAGGEPFYSKATDQFIELLDEKNILHNIQFTFNTNGTVLPTNETINRLIKSEKTFISISIDGVYDNNNFTRSGSDFKKILENLNFYKKLSKNNSNIHLGIATAVSVYNVNLLDEIYCFFEEHCSNFILERRPVFWPEVLSPRNLPVEYKNKVIDILKKSKFDFLDIIKHLDEDCNNLFEHFLNYHNKLNQLRNESFNNVNPMLDTYIKEYVRKNPNRIDSTSFFNEQKKKVNEGL